jgi:cell wall-associated NlpC family hydrolase
LRSAFIIGAFALLTAGSAVCAQAKSLPTHSTHATSAQTAAVRVAKVESPDVALWTAEATATAIAPRDGGHGVAHFAHTVLSRTSRIATELTRSALRFLGTPYVFGGTSSNGFDCSGYTQHVFAMMGVSIPRTADAQYYAGKRTKGGMRPGDLVFFQTYESGPSHVGIYLGHDRFVHASSSHGVMVSSLSDSYWSSRFLGARRLLRH